MICDGGHENPVNELIPFTKDERMGLLEQLLRKPAPEASVDEMPTFPPVRLVVQLNKKKPCILVAGYEGESLSIVFKRGDDNRLAIPVSEKDKVVFWVEEVL